MLSYPPVQLLPSPLYRMQFVKVLMISVQSLFINISLRRVANLMSYIQIGVPT